MFRRAVLTSLCVGIALLPSLLGCGFSDGVSKITVNGQTIELKETATETVRKSFQTPAAPRVRVEVFAGKIAVEKGADGKVEAEVTKTAAGESKEEAQTHLQLIDVQMQQEGDTIRITARRPDVQGQDREALKKRFGARSADAVVRVPAGAALELKSAFGDVSAKGIAGRVEADTSSGAVTMTDGSGELKLTSGFGKIRVEGHNKAVNASSKSGDITVHGAQGPIDASSGFGAVTIDGAAVKVTAHSNSGNVTVKAGQAPVKADSGFGKITVDGGSTIDAESKSGDIVVRGAAGAVKLHSGFGKIDADVAGARVRASTTSGAVQVRGRLSDGDHELHSNFGNISLALPADSQFRLDAQTKFGRASTTFDLAGSAKKDDKHLTGTVGDEPKCTIKLTTNSGNIEVRKE